MAARVVSKDMGGEHANMCIAIAHDPAPRSGQPSLYWLDDRGRVVTAHGPLQGGAELSWVGLSAYRSRLLLWSTERLDILDVREGTGERTRGVNGVYERAGWVGDSAPDAYEVYYHETSGHPTDRGGYRLRRHARSPDSSGEQLARRQGHAPPWGASGAWPDHGDVCSSPLGRVLRSWRDGQYVFRWAPAGSRARFHLPVTLSRFSAFHILEGPEGVVVGATHQSDLALCAVLRRGTSKRQPFTWRAPGALHALLTHEGQILAALSGHDPRVVPGAYKALSG